MPHVPTPRQWLASVAALIGVALSMVVPSGAHAAVQPIPQTGHQIMSAAAWNGDVHLVVWMANTITSNATDLYGTRVAADGTVLDPGGFPIVTAASQQWWPRVASDGTDFIVVWTDFRSGDMDVYGTRVKANGTVEHPGGRPIIAGEQDESSHDLVWSGDQYSLAWGTRHPRPGPSIAITELGRDGSPVDGSPVIVSDTAPMQRGGASLAWNGTTTLVAWAETTSGEASRVRYVRLDGGGNVIERVPGVVVDGGNAVHGADGGLYALRVATDQHDFIVAWSRQKGPYVDYDIRASRIDGDGNLIDVIPMLVASGLETAEDLDVAWDGKSYLAVWKSGGSWRSYIHQARVSGDATMSPPSVAAGARLSDNGVEEYPAISAATDHYLVLWNTYGMVEDLFGAIGPSGGPTSSPFVLAA